MTVFGKRFTDYFRFVRTGLIVIVAVGVARFLLGFSGVPYERVTHLASMTIVTLLLAVVYGQQARARAFGENYRVPHFTDYRRMLDELRLAPVLAGARGRPPVDVAAVADAIVRLGALMHAVSRLVELELNPLIATPQGVMGLDARGVLA